MQQAARRQNLAGSFLRLIAFHVRPNDRVSAPARDTADQCHLGGGATRASGLFRGSNTALTCARARSDLHRVLRLFRGLNCAEGCLNCCGRCWAYSLAGKFGLEVLFFNLLDLQEVAVMNYRGECCNNWMEYYAVELSFFVLWLWMIFLKYFRYNIIKDTLFMIYRFSGFSS